MQSFHVASIYGDGDRGRFVCDKLMTGVLQVASCLATTVGLLAVFIRLRKTTRGDLT
ncbi:hypothetical protein [Granulicella sp. WH15]|uniref:hypothetical protein n=1 Tax=Granulicella sp. WH15 TaxID=2602070 RepID=UPI0013A54F92|nr:hypothetical protein [Granulicella sp. WH15]